MDAAWFKIAKYLANSIASEHFYLFMFWCSKTKGLLVCITVRNFYSAHRIGFPFNATILTLVMVI